MNRLIKVVINTGQGFIKAVSRFPLTVICLIGATIVTCYIISLHKEPSLFIQKLLFAFGLGAFLSMAAQFCCERFPRLQKLRLLVCLIAVLLIGGYYLIIAPAPSIDYAVKPVLLLLSLPCFASIFGCRHLKERLLLTTSLNLTALL